jgi:Type ISP C-terminal specificity domain
MDNDRQHAKGGPEAAWTFPIGGYMPAQRWLKDRIGRTLDYEEQAEYQRIIWALLETRRVGDNAPYLSCLGNTSVARAQEIWPGMPERLVWHFGEKSDGKARSKPSASQEIARRSLLFLCCSSIGALLFLYWWSCSPVGLRWYSQSRHGVATALMPGFDRPASVVIQPKSHSSFYICQPVSAAIECRTCDYFIE